MRVFMLGWEFPPFISGGLGTACYGLTKALSRQHTHITFVLPKAVDTEEESHVRVLAPAPAPGQPRPAQPRRSPAAAAPQPQAGSPEDRPEAPPQDRPADDSLRPDEPGEFERVTFLAVPSRITSPYGRPPGSWAPQAGPSAAEAGITLGAPGSTPPGDPSGDRWAHLGRASSSHVQDFRRPMGVLQAEHAPGTPGAPAPSGRGPGSAYQGDLMVEAQRYAKLCVELARHDSFDVVHAHDWLTFPAGMAVAAATGKPLVVHVHSTEYDRSGESINRQIYDIERRGMHAAVRVIAVSHLTRAILERRYGVAPERIDVVYNGIDDTRPAHLPNSAAAIRPNDKIVLFLGRITMQKGPEYFVAAAKKVLEKIDRVKFVMAGSGDLITDIIELAAREGIGHKVTFTGFLHGPDVSRIFQMADVYVMPSVSEPFGIAALEAIRHDVPAIISRTSGVSEVLRHALKVDFWDVNDIADKIIAVLKHSPLASTLRHQAELEIRQLTWDDAASHCHDVYQTAIAAMPK